MNLARFLLLFVCFTAVDFVNAGIDYRIDPTFVSPFGPSTIHDIHVLANGQIIIAGENGPSGGNTVPMVRRLNTDGSIDNSFVVPTLSPVGSNGLIRKIKVLPDGKYLLIGSFGINSTFTNYARLNQDGSWDSTLPVGQGNIRGFQPDGKLIGCGARVFGGVTYQVAWRVHPDGGHDPTFQVTFANNSSGCDDVQVLPNGKILMNGFFRVGTQQMKSLYQLNSDGSKDSGFEAAIPDVYDVDEFFVMNDGKILIAIEGQAERLLSDGSLDLTISNCVGGSFLPMPDGNVLMKECKKWSGTQVPFNIGRVTPDGTVDPSLDRIFFSPPTVMRFESAGGSDLYAYGGFSLINQTQQRAIVRLITDSRPRKAPFDFDGDGISDVAVYRPSDGVWYLNQSSDGLSYRTWGLPGDRPAAGDINRDGKTDIAIFRNGQWHGIASGTGSHQFMCLGGSGDKPMSFFLTDTWSDRQYYAAHATRNGLSRWYILQGFSAWCTVPPTVPETMLAGELTTDTPVVGDFDADSRDEIGYFRNGFWYSADFESVTPPRSFQWGIAGDIPVPGDYDGDRQTDYAVFRPSTGDWWINRSSAGVFVIHFGLNGDIPVPADYDGDGKFDVAIYRNGAWWQVFSSTGTTNVVNWGIAGDIPIPAQTQF